MLWIKRNLWLVGIGAGGSFLLIVGGLYLWSGMQKREKAIAELNEVRSSMNSISGDATQKRLAELEGINAALNRLVVGGLQLARPVKAGENFDAKRFKNELLSNLDALRVQAHAANVQLPGTNYGFSFDAWVPQVNFNQETIPAMSQQVADVRGLVECLIRSKVDLVLRVRRVMTSQYDALNSGDILAATNGHFTIPSETGSRTRVEAWPYELQFECFSAALASAFTELNAMPNLVLVKLLRVERKRDTMRTVVSNVATNAAIPTVRPGGRPRPGFRGSAPATPAAPGSARPSAEGLLLIEDEQPLVVTMSVAVLKQASIPVSPQLR